MRIAGTLVLLLGAVAMAQTQGAAKQQSPPSVASDKAKQHLITFVQPTYPPLAKAAHIMGVVHATVEVDENGNVKEVKLISGHPMLGPAALDAIRKWKYKPFEIDGRPCAISTEALVFIPENVRQSDIDRERSFQDEYWPNERAAQDALKKGDLTTAEAKLLLARSAVEGAGDKRWLELADVVTMLGDIKERQNDYIGAEKLLEESLAIHRKHQRPDEAELAGSEFNLAALYVQMQRVPEAEPLLMEAARAWEMRISDTSMPEAKASYGRHLALSYFAAARIAAESSRPAEAQFRCKKALSYADQWPEQTYTPTIRSVCSSLLQTH